MRMKSLKLLPLLLAGALFFVSCEKDEVSNLSQEEAQQVIQNTEQNLVSETQNIASTDGYMIMSEMGQMLPQEFYFNDPGMKSTSVFNVKESLKNVEKKLSLENPELDFEFDHFILDNFNYLVGTWEYTPNGWEHTNTPSDKVIVKYPHPMDNATNNVVVTFYDYSEQENGSEVFINSIKVKVEYNGNEVLTFSYNGTLEGGISFGSTGDSFNFKLSTEVTLTFGQYEVYSYKMINATSSTQMNFAKELTVKKAGSRIYAQIADMSVAFNENQTADIAINAKQIVYDLEFRMTVQGNSEELDSNQDPNQFIQMSLYKTNGDKVGDFIFVAEGNDWVVYFKFTNGQQVKAEELMPNLANELEMFFEDLMTEGSL